MGEHKTKLQQNTRWLIFLFCLLVGDRDPLFPTKTVKTSAHTHTHTHTHTDARLMWAAAATPALLEPVSLDDEACYHL